MDFKSDTVHLIDAWKEGGITYVTYTQAIRINMMLPHSSTWELSQATVVATRYLSSVKYNASWSRSRIVVQVKVCIEVIVITKFWCVLKFDMNCLYSN